MELFVLIYAILGVLLLLWTNEGAQKVFGYILGALFVIALWPIFVGGRIAVSAYKKYCPHAKK